MTDIIPTDVKTIAITKGANIVEFVVYGLIGVLIVGLGMKAIFGGNFADLATTIASLI